MKRYRIILIFILVWTFSQAKVLSVKIGVNGLTCPMCTRSVEMEIRKLSFVKEVTMNLEHTEGVITFNENETVNFHRIAKAVVDAGFTVRFLSAEIKVEGQDLTESDVCHTFDNNLFSLVDQKKAGVGETIQVMFIGKAYQEKQEYQKWKPRVKAGCKGADSREVYTVAMI